MKRKLILQIFFKRRIYKYILVEYFVLNINTKWMLLTKQKIDWLISKKQIEKNINYFFLKRASSNLLVNKIKSIVAFKMSDW